VHSYVRADIQRDDPLYALFIEGFPSYSHLPAMAEKLGESWLQSRMADTEARYLLYKETGTTQRGRSLPAEKPIDEIGPEEIGLYKDVFILEDRAPLFLHYLRTIGGKNAYARFCHGLFDAGEIDDAEFRQRIVDTLGIPRTDVDLWLSTNAYPARFHLR
jgi:hypothetical protein